MEWLLQIQSELFKDLLKSFDVNYFHGNLFATEEECFKSARRCGAAPQSADAVMTTYAHMCFCSSSNLEYEEYLSGLKSVKISHKLSH